MIYDLIRKCDKIFRRVKKGVKNLKKDKTTNIPDTLAARRKRINRIKIWIIVIALIFMILPTILCIILFLKYNSLQNQIDLLMISRYDATYGELTGKDDNLVHAAVKDKTDKNEMNKAENTNTSDSNVDQPKDIELTKSQTTDTLEDEKKETKKKDEIFKDKTVYLTFDDGPSSYTDDLLDILSLYHVKATFFVIGKTDDNSKRLYQRIVEEGHTLGMHSYSHKYKDIYKSLDNFDKDFTKLSDLLYDTTGYLPTIYRFPGGSSNNVSSTYISEFIQYLNSKSIAYYDWNVVNGDATGKDLTPNELYNNVINGVKTFDTSIVLMHDTDTKINTVDSLLHILKTLTNEGANILPISEDVTPIQQVKDSSLEK
jgi:peptidoglycan/xylan/chitin deacetylase (PgdA/CDA1 family)